MKPDAHEVQVMRVAEFTYIKGVYNYFYFNTCIVHLLLFFIITNFFFSWHYNALWVLYFAALWRCYSLLAYGVT